MKRILKNIMKLLLFVTVLNSIIFANAQRIEEVPFYVDLDFNIGRNYAYKTINGFDDPVFCLDFSNGPYTIGISSFSKISESKVINVSLYVPTKAFTNAYVICSDFVYYDGSRYIYPTFNDLEKIK